VDGYRDIERRIGQFPGMYAGGVEHDLGDVLNLCGYGHNIIPSSVQIMYSIAV
jgi:hypothetical protein